MTGGWEAEGIARRLKSVRQEAGLKQAEFAEKVGQFSGGTVTCSDQSVMSRERTDREGLPVRAPGDYLAVVCLKWDIHPVWLLTGIGPREWDREGEIERDRLAAADWMERLADELREGKL